MQEGEVRLDGKIIFSSHSRRRYNIREEEFDKQNELAVEEMAELAGNFHARLKS